MSETSPTRNPDAAPGPNPSPGDVRPRRTLERPPSARFQADGGATSGQAPAGEPGGRGVLGAGGPRTAVGVGIVGAVAIALLNAVLAVTTGLVAVAGVTGYLIGLALRLGTGPNPPGGSTGAPRGSSATSHAAGAIGLALLTVLAGAVGTWLVAIPQGNLLGPLDYLGQTLGILLPVQAVVAMVGAWLGSR